MVLHRFGDWLYKKLNRQDFVALKNVHVELKDLDSVLLGRTGAILDRVFITDTFLDKAVWDRNGERWTDGLTGKVDRQYNQISRQAVRLERDTFFDLARTCVAYFRHLYQGREYVKESVTEAVILEGLEIIGPSEFKDFIRTAVSGLPQSNLDGLRSITKKAYRNSSAYFSRTKKIFIAPGLQMKAHLMHEIGHHVSYQFPTSGTSSLKIADAYIHKANEVLRKANPIWKKQGQRQIQSVYVLGENWRRLEGLPGLPIPSAYSMKNISEYYAESYKTYISNPAKLKAIDPAVYEHLKSTVFEGKEFLGIPSKTSLAIGRGKVTQEFKRFLAGQFAAGTSPRTLIKTISLEHQALVRNSLVSGIEQGAHLGMVKADVMKTIGADLTGPQRRKLENNTMRILRTSHQQAANHSLNYFAEQNTNVVRGLTRTAGGRPCIACVPGYTMIWTKRGLKSIESIGVGDEVLGGVSGSLRKVTKIFRRRHQGELYTVTTNRGIVDLTPEHPIGVFRDQKRDWVLPEDLKLKDQLVCCPEENWTNFCVGTIESLSVEKDVDMVVHNLEVEKDECYVANGIVVHNCAFLDGTTYPVGSHLEDHPNGLCLFVLDIKTPAEMGFTQPAPGSSAAWKAEGQPYPDMASRFYAMSPDEQRRMFGNDALYDLWKREGFSPEHLIVYRDGMPGVMTYQAALTQYKNWPKVEVGKVAASV